MIKPLSISAAFSPFSRSGIPPPHGTGAHHGRNPLLLGILFLLSLVRSKPRGCQASDVCPEIATPRPGHLDARPGISTLHLEISTMNLEISTLHLEISTMNLEISTLHLEISDFNAGWSSHCQQCRVDLFQSLRSRCKARMQYLNAKNGDV